MLKLVSVQLCNQQLAELLSQFSCTWLVIDDDAGN